MHDTRVQEIARAISEMGNQVVICGVRSKDSPERPQQIGKDLTLDYIEQPTKEELISGLVSKLENLYSIIKYLIKIIKFIGYEVTFIVAPIFSIIGFHLIFGAKHGGWIISAAMLLLTLSFYSKIKVRPWLGRVVYGTIYEEKFFEYIESYKPDIIHCNDLPVLRIAAIYKRKNPDIKLVYDSHEIYSGMSGVSFFERYKWKAVERKAAKLASAFITVNPYIKEILEKANPCLPKGLVVRNAFHKKNEIYKTSSKKLLSGAENIIKKTIFAECGGSNLFATQRSKEIFNKKILLFQGGIGPGRGLDKLVDAAKYLDNPWIIVFIGWGSLQDELEASASRAGLLNEKVFFLPKVSRKKLNVWTRAADVGVIPYQKVSMNNWYCSPNKLWEYPSCGVPILASPNPYMVDVIEKNRIGWILPEDFEGRDIASIINSLEQKEINEKSNSCYKFSVENSWDNEKLKVEEAYNSI